MKRSIPMTLSLLAVLGLLASCEKNQDFQKVVDAPSTLAYVPEAGVDNAQKASLVVIPSGYIHHDKFYQVNVNTSLHPAATATLTVSEADLPAYNAAHKTAYQLLPAANFSVSAYVKPEPVEGEETAEVEDPFTPSNSATVHISENERLSDEFVRFRLGGDLASLTEENYLVPLRLECSPLDLSQKRNVLYLLVNITERVVKPLDSVNDIDGSLVTTRTGWTATTSDGITNLGNIFTSSNTSGATFPSEDPLTFTVDMKAVHQVTGIKLLTMYASYGYTDVTINKIGYSLDGEDFEEMEIDPESELAYGNDNGANVGFYVPLAMQYVRVTATVRSYVGANYRRLVQFYIYE